MVSLFNAWHADKTQEKFWHIVVPIFFGLVGFIISMSTSNTGGRYVALFLQAQSYAGFIVFYSWICECLSSPSRVLYNGERSAYMYQTQSTGA